MRFIRRPRSKPRRLGILPSAFHPPTRAHIALAQSALDTFQTEEVLFVLPEKFPHKAYGAVTLEQRLSLVAAATAHESRFSIAVAPAGLFLDIARECRGHYAADVRLRFLCGRDAAERIISWDYGSLPPIHRQLEEYDLLVAARHGAFHPPPHLAAFVTALELPSELEHVSSTLVRDRIAAGGEWEHWIPSAIVDQVRSLYAPQQP